MALTKPQILGISLCASALSAFIVAVGVTKPNTVADEDLFDRGMSSVILAGSDPQNELICWEASDDGTREAFYFASRPAEAPDEYFSLSRTNGAYSLALLPTTSEFRSFNNFYYGERLHGDDRADAQEAYDNLRRFANDGNKCSYMADHRLNSYDYEQRVRAHLALEQ